MGSHAWARAASLLGGDEEAARLDGSDLEQRYAEPHRRYHTGEHITAVLADGAWLADALALADADRALLTLAACDLVDPHARGAGRDPVAAALLDADLAILRAEPPAYDGYSQAVRDEYSRVPDDLWRAGRQSVLNSLLGRPSIFVTAPAIGRWESAARANVRRELRGLAV